MAMTDTETKLVARLKDWYLGAADETKNREWRQRAAKCLRFYNGSGQWDESVKMLLEDQNRPALTINKILPTVNVVWGQLIQNRNELRLEALRRGTKEIAELGSALLKHAMDCCEGYDASSDAFRDGLITGKGWTTADLVYDRDPVTGELVVEAPNPLFIYEDPRNTDYDVNKGEYVFRERFWTKNKLKAYFPKKYDEAMAAMGYDWYQPISEESGNTLSGLVNYLNEGSALAVLGEGNELSGVIVRECWWREYERVRMATIRTPDGGEMTVTLKGRNDNAKLAEFEAARPEFAIGRHETVLCNLHLAVMVGDLLLKTEQNPLYGCKMFPYVRNSPYWLHGDAFGVVDNLIGPQEELNKSRSNLLHDANMNGNPAWRAKRATPKGSRMVHQFGSTPGVLLEEDDFGGKIERVEPGQLSQAHRELSERNAADMLEISGVNPNLLGTPTERAESGRARLIQQEAGLKVLAPVMGNYARSQAILGTMIWEFIRHNNVYSPEEIEAIAEEQTIAALGGMRGVVEAMNRWDVGTYGVKAVPSKTTATWTDVQMDEISRVMEIFAKTGLVPPPQLSQELAIQVIELSSFPGAGRIADMLRQIPAQVAMPQMAGASGPAGTQQGTRTGAVVAAQGGAPY